MREVGVDALERTAETFLVVEFGLLETLSAAFGESMPISNSTGVSGTPAFFAALRTASVTIGFSARPAPPIADS